MQQLELLQKKLYAYHCADSSLYLDAVTTAPSDTTEGRGVAMSILAGEGQKLMTSPETKVLLDELSARAGATSHPSRSGCGKMSTSTAG